jgi:hypothetical protein
MGWTVEVPGSVKSRPPVVGSPSCRKKHSPGPEQFLSPVRQKVQGVKGGSSLESSMQVEGKVGSDALGKV